MSNIPLESDTVRYLLVSKHQFLIRKKKSWDIYKWNTLANRKDELINANLVIRAPYWLLSFYDFIGSFDEMTFL